MKRSLFAFAAVSILATVIATGAQTFTRAATPSPSTTFPSLTTIYVGTGVRDNGAAENLGVATVFHCSNVSGVTATLRILALDPAGGNDGEFSSGMAHGETVTIGTHRTAAYGENDILATGNLNGGAVNIESTQSGVFCSAVTIDAAVISPDGVPLRLVRVNPHPGTVE